MDDRPSVVYWLHDAGCSDPATDGYIGVTCRFESRIREHRKPGKFPNGFQVSVLFRGTRKDCVSKEKQYRPRPHVGWNYASGGHHFLHTDETRAKIGEAGRGKAYCLGQKFTEERKQKIGAALRGRKATPEAKANMSVAQKSVARCGPGVEISRIGGLARRGVKHSAETLAKLRGNKNCRGHRNNPHGPGAEGARKISQALTTFCATLTADEKRKRMEPAFMARKPHHPTQETRRKLSEAMKRVWEERKHG
jgi:NUMOD3 motif